MCVCVCACACMCVHTSVHACECVCVCACMRLCVHMCACSCMTTHTYSEFLHKCQHLHICGYPQPSKIKLCGRKYFSYRNLYGRLVNHCRCSYKYASPEAPDVVSLFLLPLYRFSFPSVFIVYQTLTLGLFELFVLIGFTDREQLYCSARDLQESVKDASPYCEAIGNVRCVWAGARWITYLSLIIIMLLMIEFGIQSFCYWYSAQLVYGGCHVNSIFGVGWML